MGKSIVCWTVVTRERLSCRCGFEGRANARDAGWALRQNAITILFVLRVVRYNWCLQWHLRVQR